MMKTIVLRKIIAALIPILFVIINMVPIIENSTARRTDAAIYDSSYQEQHQIFEDLPKQKILPYSVAPQTSTTNPAPSIDTLKNNHHPKSYRISELLERSDIAYAYNAYDPSGEHLIGMVSFDLNNPYDIDIELGVIPGLITGADFLDETIMYFCIYQGGLFRYDIISHEAIYIGPTIPLLGLTFDAETGVWYASDSENLYIIDIDTGATTLIGPFCISTTMIDIASDLEGNIYGNNVLWTGDSTLYSVDKTTGLATAIGSMGCGLVYLQGMAYDRDNSILYIAGYFNDGSPAGLLICDTTSGQCMLVGNFEGGMEITGFAIPWSPNQYDHDIAIRSIIKPASGNAGPITPVVKVKNAGLNTEYNVPVQLLIGKELISGTVEDFEATNAGYTHAPKLPQPDAWAWGAPTSGPMAAHSGFNVWATNLAGPYPPSMWCYLLTAPFTVPGGAMFNFWHWYYFESNYDGGNVKISNDDGVTWTLITPVGSYPGAMPYNPFMTGQACYNGQSGGWKQANFDLSAYEGQLVQIMFETSSDSSVQYAGWYIDDVGFTSTSWVNEYTQTAYVSSIAPEEVVELSFPTWTPSDLGLVENVNINYNAEATALLVGDENINNDYKEKAFKLHYGFFHDVAVVDIISPVSGLAETQTPEVVIENHGQNSESVNVQMTIGKAIYTTLIEEDFAGGVPPAGWGTNYPENWYSSSTNYAGGTAPEAEFSWTPSSVGEHLLYTGNIDTTGFTALGLKFKEYVNDYNGDYTLKVVTSTDGGATWSDAYVRAGGPYGPATTDVTLTAANGVGSATFQIAWDYSGDSFNINYWYIDDIWLGTIELNEEYNETISTMMTAGSNLDILFPEWTPADIPFATSIDYFIDASVSMNISDGNPADNQITALITLSYEHDVGVFEITQPRMTCYLGRYPIEGIIQNYGVTYPESNIPVNAQFEFNGVVIYNETVIAPGPLPPGAQTTVVFPNITIPEEHYYDWKLTMQTQLANDDHPNNNKKTKTGSFGWDIYPPVTTAIVTGTMGLNDWYISNVQVTLTATDGKWPSGVNNTYYKVDDGVWHIYSIQIIVETDGQHTVFFYSDDNMMPPNVEEVKNVSFKIDQTTPSITMSVEKNGFRQWKFLATVSDETSGVSFVECYIDFTIMGTIAAPGPYEWNWTGKGNHTVTGIAYDIAGNSAENDVVFSYSLSEIFSQRSWFFSLLAKIIQRILPFLPMFQS